MKLPALGALQVAELDLTIAGGGEMDQGHVAEGVAHLARAEALVADGCASGESFNDATGRSGRGGGSEGNCAMSGVLID